MRNGARNSAGNLTHLSESRKIESYRNRKIADGERVVRKGITLEYRYLSLTGAYIGHRWLSPFGLYESMIRGNKQQASSEHPECIMEAEISLVRESVGNEARNALLITPGDLIRCWITPEFEGKMNGREVYG